MNRALVQIVPGLDPWGGVSNHAQALRRALEEQQGLSTRFVLPANGGGGAGTTGRRAAALVAELDATGSARILLHYANYGYARRGCPRWLIDGLERWKAGASGRRLVTIFHELYATGLPWQSSFWLSPLQRHLAKRLQRLNDRAVTSLELYGEMLRAWDPASVVSTLPVFSTVGEPAETSALRSRRPHLVVFGSAGIRARAYRRSAPALARACAALGIEEVVDVGPRTTTPAVIAGVPVRVLGEQPAQEVSALLAESIAGFLCYPRALLAKSTVFAAFCAHRSLPICAWPRRNNASQQSSRRAAIPHWKPEGDGQPEWQAIADAASLWYRDHTLARHTALYSSLLQ